MALRISARMLRRLNKAVELLQRQNPDLPLNRVDVARLFIEEGLDRLEAKTSVH